MDSQPPPNLYTTVNTNLATKYNKACALCRRSHKRCDGNLPCRRCLQKGWQNRCYFPVRKRQANNKNTSPAKQMDSLVPSVKTNPHASESNVRPVPLKPHMSEGMNLQPSYNYPSITEDYNSEQPHFGNFVMDASNTVDDNVRFSPSLTDSTNNNNSCLEYVNNTNYYRYYNNNDNCQLVQTSNGYHLGAKNLPLKQHSMFCHWSTNDSKSTKKTRKEGEK